MSEETTMTTTYGPLQTVTGTKGAGKRRRPTMKKLSEKVVGRVKTMAARKAMGV